MIRIQDLQDWRAERIADGSCSFDDMVALGEFIAKVEKLTMKASRIHALEVNGANIGETIRDLRLSRGWSQAQLCERSGVGYPSSISAYENGVHQPSFFNAECMFKALGRKVFIEGDYDE